MMLNPHPGAEAFVYGHWVGATCYDECSFLKTVKHNGSNGAERSIGLLVPSRCLLDMMPLCLMKLFFVQRGEPLGTSQPYAMVHCL